MPEQASKEKGMAASDGSSFPLILEHCMLNPSSYEIPLRSMYALNCQTLSLKSAAGLKEAGLATQNSTEPLADAASQFKAQLISHISRSPNQFDLPVGFMVSFVRRAFAPNLEDVDFPQAFAALDYLKNLHRRRQKEILAALESLAIDLVPSKSHFLRISQTQKQELQLTYPGVVAWVESIEKRDREAHYLYRNVCLGLRRWTLINEMWLEPFHKGNCMAMLNTLFPPAIHNAKAPSAASADLTLEEVAQQRQGFFDCIGIIERQGKVAIESLLTTGARAGEETAWPMVHEFLEKYLDLATETIHDCAQVKGREYLEAEVRGKTHKRNADSGVSFTSVHESLSTTTTTTESRAGTPLDKSRSPTPDTKQGKSTLEKISKQLRKIRSRPDIKEPGKPKTVSKKKSLTALVSGRSASSSSAETNFDVDEFKRKRMIWEANERKKAALQGAQNGRETPKQVYDD
ncbi:hypothetical protein UA08_04274 [Talaromyces atroroseus]|uniref:Uncharacterized protein n=1 Tax=Talaromyces atroroseus TaxID=1441469 RepID=A0A1Q5Q9F3_TALAT|nr:hypothetical protein UA08_04274 [Talaromyces atroroseus]OKL60763.1 hypothetical protein UA08_04274 [Talaromyces atroroseus]